MFVTRGDDEDILRALSEGSEEAFLKIYELYWYKVFLIAYKRLRKKDIAEELTQDLFLKLWEKRRTLKPQKLDNYLCVSIRNSVIDHINSGLVANKYVDFYMAFVESSSSETQHTVEFDDLSEAIEYRDLVLLHQVGHTGRVFGDDIGFVFLNARPVKAESRYL